MNDNATTYSPAKKCDNCSTINEETRNSCRECGLLLLKKCHPSNPKDKKQKHYAPTATEEQSTWTHTAKEHTATPADTQSSSKLINTTNTKEENKCRKSGGELRITIPELAPSVNHIWKHSNRGGFVRTYLTKEGREFKDRVSSAVPEGHVPYAGPLRMELELVFPNNIRRDIDNYTKGILDGLNHKAFEDDSQIQELVIRKRVEKNKPAIHIIIQEAERV